MSLSQATKVLAASGAVASASTETFDIETRGRSGLIVVIDTTAITSGAVITPTLLGVDPTSGHTWSILAGAALSAAGASTVALRVSPASTAVANLAVADLVPATVRLSIAHADAKSYTRAITAILCQ